MIWEYKIQAIDSMGNGIKKGHFITFNTADAYSVKVTNAKGKEVDGDLSWYNKKEMNNSEYAEDKSRFKLIHKKIGIEKSCEPYMYNTNYDLNKLSEGDVIELTFQKKFKVEKKYAGKKVKFKVMNSFEHCWRRPTKRLAMVPVDNVDDYDSDDVLYLDDYDRFECLMIDLFACNRKPYAGWKNKEVKVKKIN